MTKKTASADSYLVPFVYSYTSIDYREETHLKRRDDILAESYVLHESTNRAECEYLHHRNFFFTNR